MNNLYILFESARLAFSPKFQGGNASKFITKSNKNVRKKLSIKLELGKIIAWSVVFVLATVEPIVGSGEVMTIYARKN